MKRYIHRYIKVLAISCMTTACNLDVTPPASLSVDKFWKTEKDAWYALNGCYTSMPSIDIFDEMCTDNAHSHKPWEGNMELVQQNGINTASPYGNYNFTSVRQANTFITHVEQCEMDQELKERMKAEARFFRAFAYLNLTQYFGKVPLVTEELPYDAPLCPRNSKEEVRDFILTELEQVADILPASYKGGYMHEIGRVTKYAALSLRARAALYFGNYQEAEKSAKAVIESGQYDLFKLSSLTADQKKEADEMDLYIDFDEKGVDKTNFILGMFSYESLWLGEHATPKNPEYILTREYMEDPKAYDPNRYTYFIPQQMSILYGFSSYEPMQDLVDAYWNIDGKTLPSPISVDERKTNYATIWNAAKGLNDAEFNEFARSQRLMTYEYMKEFKNRDSRLYASILFPFKGWHETAIGEHYFKWDPDVVNKNGNESWTGFSYRKMVTLNPYKEGYYGSADDYPTIRYAEVLLTFAEAHLMTTGWDEQVRSALDKIRNRCGMPAVPQNLTKQDAIDFVRNERRIELAVEGHRFDDVRRYGEEYCQKYLNGPSTAPDGSVVVNKKWDKRLMLMPIPTSAIDMNPLLKDDQNPGY